MINYLQVENLTKSYGDLVLFDNISFTIGEGQRIALIGRNGSGKTTLLNILAGKDTADSGTITPRRDLRIAYLEQNPEYAADLTVLEACFRSDNPALRAIAAYEQAVADPAQDGLQEAMSRMDALAAWDYEQRAKEILSRLKINDFDKKIGQLSGGQLKRVALAAVLISEADLAELFKVFGDSTRIRILFVLFEAEVCVCDLAKVLNMTQSAISHQLRILKANKLVNSRREGKSVFYSLADGHVRTIIAQGREHIEE